MHNQPAILLEQSILPYLHLILLSCVALSEIPSYFALIYLIYPPQPSNYAVDNLLLLNCFEFNLLKSEEVLHQNAYGNSCSFHFLGDFNFSCNDRNTYSSSSAYERTFPEFFIKKCFLQFVTEAPHNRNNNILDLTNSHELSISASVGKLFFSDHYLICFESTCPPYALQSSYSKSSFNVQTFKDNLQCLFDLASNNSCIIESHQED